MFHSDGWPSRARAFALLCTRRFLNVFAWVTLGAGGFLGMLFAAPNRQAILWTRRDTVELFLFLAVGSLLASVVLTWADQWFRGAVKRNARHFIYLLLAAAIIQIVPPRHIYRYLIDDVVYAIALVVGLFLSFWSLRFPRNRLTSRLWSGSRVLFLIPFLLFANLLRFPSLPESPDFSPKNRTAVNPERPPVILFTFDSIAWIHCMDADGRVRADLPALRVLQEQSLDWSRARSPGRCTMVSIPNLIFQRDPSEWNHPEWRDDILRLDPRAFTNGLFSLAKEAGYRTTILGMYLPYTRMLGDLLDQAFVLASYGRFRDTGLPFTPRQNNLVMNILQNVRGPFPERWFRYFPHLRYAERTYNRYYVEMNHAIEARTLSFFGNHLGPGDFVMVEMPVPHWPYVFLPDGSIGPGADYNTHLQYADRVLNGFLDALRQAGLYDASWILFTSDHGQDYTRNAEKNHVPLLIKPPAGTIPARRIDTPILMWEMGPFFREVFQGRPAEECAARLPVDENVDSAAPDG